VVNSKLQSVVWVARFLGLGVAERVAGIDLMGRLIALCESEGRPVYVRGDLVVTPAKRARYRLHELLRQVTSKNVHAEMDAGAPVGREVW